VLAAARALFEAALDGTRLDPLLLPVVARLAGHDADVRLYSRMEEVASRASSADDQVDALDALTNVARPELVTRALTLVASDRIRSQDTAAVLAALLRSPAAGHEALGFIGSHWGAIEAKIGGLLAAPTLVASAASFCDPAARDEVKRLFGARVPAARRTLQQAVETIDVCIAMKRREASDLAEWLRR
jgi:hypothetical protein